MRQLIASEGFATLPAEDSGLGPQRILEVHLDGLVRDVYSCYVTPQQESQQHLDRIWTFVTSLVPPPIYFASVMWHSLGFTIFV